jgi:2-oxoglutarate ferredoxin oxidoreductase subunit gamma
MTEQILIAGSGGQGVLTLGIMLARIAVFEKKNAAWLPSYGAEKRGGFSFCSLVISDEEIYSPVVETPDTLIIFDQRALETYGPRASEKTMIIENSSLVLTQTAALGTRLNVPAGDIAKKLESGKVMNVAMAGAYLAAKKIFSYESAGIVMREMLGKKAGGLMQKNIEALKLGFESVK